MANPLLDLHCDQPDPNWHPQTFGEACAFIDQLLRGSVQGSYTPFVSGSSTPAVADQDKLWFKLGPDGQPLGFYGFYNGMWRRAYTGMFNQIVPYAGDPSFFFDSNGRGIIGGEWDGWHLCNGLDGVINLTDKFIVSAHMDNTGGIAMHGSGGWQTGVSGAPTNNGGQSQVTLAESQIPRAATDKIVADKWAASGNARSSSGQLYGLHSEATADADTFTIVPADNGNPDVTNPDATLTPVWTLPPYIVLGFAVFTGYEPVS